MITTEYFLRNKEACIFEDILTLKDRMKDFLLNDFTKMKFFNKESAYKLADLYICSLEEINKELDRRNKRCV